MACPNCGCKETYQLTGCLEDLDGDDCDRTQRCAACNCVFDLDDHLPEEDDEDYGCTGG